MDGANATAELTGLLLCRCANRGAFLHMQTTCIVLTVCMIIIKHANHLHYCDSLHDNH